MKIYNAINQAKATKQKLLAILIDPEKAELKTLAALAEKINQSPTTHILVGGSTFDGSLDTLIIELKKHTALPILLFPGAFNQISDKADGILFLNLLSGRNPDYLAEHQINAVPFLEKTNLEILPTAYLLIESGIKTAVERVSQTKPLSRSDIKYVSQTAKAGQYMGNKLVYLEAGSGAEKTVPLEMIRAVSQIVAVPIIVGGGIRSKEKIEEAFEAGASMVVIGTAFENDSTFFD